MKTFNRASGKIGEKIAEDYLLNKGFEFVQRNFSTKFGEIDLIMQDRDILVFVEVKTKKGLDFGTPEDMFTPGKYRRVRNMGTIYLKGQDSPCRIDMVAVLLNAEDEPISITHYPNVTG